MGADVPNTQNQSAWTTTDADLYKKVETTTVEEPSSTLTVFYVTSSNAIQYGSSYSVGIHQRYKINSLRTSIEWYSGFSPAFDYNNFITSEAAIVNIPRLFYGNSIKRGTVALDFYVSGNLVSRIEDKNQDGALIEVTGSNYGTAGIVLYNEGIIILTGSWSLSSIQDNYNYYTSSTGVTKSFREPCWYDWGKSLITPDISSSFSLDFEGVDDIITLTMLTHADRGEINTSNNKTYIQHTASNLLTLLTGTNVFKENEYCLIKNTVKSNYEDVTGSFEKQAFISSIGIYDEEKNLIAIAKLATPVRKTDSRDYTFKLKLDI
jgi:hypothetical protein